MVLGVWTWAKAAVAEPNVAAARRTRAGVRIVALLDEADAQAMPFAAEGQARRL
jgi:hypothetical protein